MKILYYGWGENERAKLALRLEPIIKEKAKERQGTRNDLNIVQKSAPSIKNKSRDELAKIAGVSHDTIEKVKFICLSRNLIRLKCYR
jgi:hypothetical protein